jgi:hypothetical protein
MFYAIHAYSPSRNQTQREFNQDELEGRPATNKQRAERLAAAYAQRLNTQQFLRATDWVGQTELSTTQTCIKSNP